MTQMLAQREHDYFAETVICANCYIVALFFYIEKALPRAHSKQYSPAVIRQGVSLYLLFISALHASATCIPSKF